MLSPADGFLFVMSECVMFPYDPCAPWMYIPDLRSKMVDPILSCCIVFVFGVCVHDILQCKSHQGQQGWLDPLRFHQLHHPPLVHLNQHPMSRDEMDRALAAEGCRDCWAEEEEEEESSCYCTGWGLCQKSATIVLYGVSPSSSKMQGYRGEPLIPWNVRWFIPGSLSSSQHSLNGWKWGWYGPVACIPLWQKGIMKHYFVDALTELGGFTDNFDWSNPEYLWSLLWFLWPNLHCCSFSNHDTPHGIQGPFSSSGAHQGHRLGRMRMRMRMRMGMRMRWGWWWEWGGWW